MEILSDFGVNGPLLLTSIVNFAVLAVVLWFVMVKPLLALLEQRELTIKTSLERAELERREAKVLEEQLAKERTEAVSQAKQMVNEATKRAGEIVKRAEADAGTKAAAIVADARQRAERERDELLEGATTHLAALVTDATRVVVGKSVTLDVDRAIVAEAIEAATKGRP